eukprot:8405005-Lingulodinium_polyedra.AAC.1
MLSVRQAGHVESACCKQPWGLENGQQSGETATWRSSSTRSVVLIVIDVRTDVVLPRSKQRLQAFGN